MRIARADRQVFNQAVSDGLYGCAPQAERGASRVFYEDDLIALFYFARLTELPGITPRFAGLMACRIRDDLKGRPAELRGGKAEPRVSYVRSTGGMGHVFNSYDPDHHAKDLGYQGLGLIAFSMEFNVAQVRELIRREMDAEARILGEDDE